MEKRRPGRPPIADKCSRLTINLPATILQKLKEEAERKDKSISALVVELIKKTI